MKEIETEGSIDLVPWVSTPGSPKYNAIRAAVEMGRKGVLAALRAQIVEWASELEKQYG